MKYKAFISYSHADTHVGQWLHKSLEGYRVPASYVGLKNEIGEVIEARLGKVFRDRDELTSRSDLSEAIHAALAASEHCVVICSPSAARSTYVNQEIIEFKRLGRGNRIHAVIVGGEPHGSTMAGQAAQECLPSALRFAVDGTGQLTDRPAPEILAPDLRPGKDEKTRAVIKLIAGLLHVDFDALYQRERRRRRRRIALLTAISASAAVVFAVLGWTAISGSAEARRQQSISAHEAYATALELADASRLAGDHKAAIDRLKKQKPANHAADLREFSWRYLWHQYDNHQHVVFVSGEPTGLDLSPDGTRLAIANGSSLVTLWDVATGRPAGRIQDPDERFDSAIFVAGGARIATSSRNEKRRDDELGIRTWNLQDTRTPERIIGGRLLPVLSRDRRTLIAGSHDFANGIRLFDVGAASETGVAFGQWLRNLQFSAISPDGRSLALGEQAAVVVVDTGSGQKTHRRDFPDDWRVTAVEFTPDGALLIVGVSWNPSTQTSVYEIVVWDLASVDESPRLQGPKAGIDGFVSIAASHDGGLVALLVGDSRIASPKQKSQLTVWERTNGRLKYALGEEQAGFTTTMQFSPTADVLATGSRDHHLRLWTASTGTLRNELGIHHEEVMREGEEQDQHREQGTVPDEERTTVPGISRLLFSQDGNTIVTASKDGAVRIWNARVEPDASDLPARADHQRAVAFSPDGRSVATGNATGEIAIWEAAKGINLLHVTGHAAEIMGLAFSSAGDRLASASVDGVVKLWTTTPFAEQQTFIGTPGETRALVFNGNRVVHLTRRMPEGRLAVADESAPTFDLRSWTLPATARPVAMTVKSSLIRLSPDGLRLAASEDGEAGGGRRCAFIIWDLQAGTSQELSVDRIPCPRLSVQDAAWSPDSKLLAVGGWNETWSGIRIFDVTSKKMRGLLPLPMDGSRHGGLTGLVFSLDGRLLASVGLLSRRTKTGAFYQPSVVTLWEVATLTKKGEFEASDQIHAGRDSLRLATFSPDGRALSFIASEPAPQAGASTVTAWRFSEPATEQFAVRERVDSVVFSAAGDRIATLMSSASNGEPAILWDRRTGRPVAALGGYEARISAVRYSQAGDALAETLEYPATGGAIAKVWNMDTRRLLASGADALGDRMRFLDLSSDGRVLGVVRADDSVAVSEIDSNRTLAAFDADATPGKDRPAQVLMPPSLIVLSSDGRLLARIGTFKTTLWDVANGKATHELSGSAPVAFARDGDTFAATTGCKTVTSWDARSGRPRSSVALDGCPSSLSLSPDGTRLLSIDSSWSGDSPRSGRLWTVKDGKGYAVLNGYADDGSVVSAFSPDGKSVATGGVHGAVNIWDPLTGRLLLTLSAPTTSASSLAFSSDGGTLVVGYVREVRVWRAAMKASSPESRTRP